MFGAEEIRKSMSTILQSPTTAPGRFGPYGGRYVPETLMVPLFELERAYETAKADASFQAQFQNLLANFAGRPTPLQFAARLTEKLGGPRIYLKREDLLHTGAHKINNAIGQGLLAVKMGKPRIIAETGAGQHGVASATVAAHLGLECVVHMGTEDMARQALNVARMRMLGAEVVAVDSGSRTLKDAINEAMRDWVTNVRTTHYLLGSVLGAHPYPTMVRDFQAVIGREAREQILAAEKRLPTHLFACVGGGSNSIGLFHQFLGDPQVKMIGIEAGGRGGNLASMRLVWLLIKGLWARGQESFRERTLTFCKTKMGKSPRRIPFPRGSTIRLSVPSMHGWRTSAARSTLPFPIRPPWMPRGCFRARKGLFPRWNRRMPLPVSWSACRN